MKMNDKKKVAILSNVTIDLIAAKLRKQYDFYIPEGFDTWVQEVINPTSVLYTTKIDAVIVLLDGTEARSWDTETEGIERIGIWKQAFSVLLERIGRIPIFVSTIDIRENRIKSLSERKVRYELENDWYQYIQDLVERKDNVYLLDIADTIMEIGRRQFYSNKMWYMSNMPYSRDGLDAVSIEIGRVLDAAFKGRRKAITVDLDNTLWGGVIGEDGIEGIELSKHKEGQRYYDFQRQLFEMKKRGIVFTINSKNNPEDAEMAIEKHPSMIFRIEDFVSRKINWESKVVNLKATIDELNLTEGGFIFVDDNPVEREMVKGECAGVLVPDFPADTTELLVFAENLWFEHCRPLRILDEDRKKTQMYRNEAKRKQDLSQSLNLDDYIAKLEMQVDIHRMRPEEIERVTQLINKTNQFNVTTNRYTKAEIEEIANARDKAIYVTSSSDKYGEHGLISVIVLVENNGSVRIDSFLMSCRVMGRRLEDVIMNEILAKYMDRKVFVGEFKQTEKNLPVKNLYDRLGFKLVTEKDGQKIYEFDMKDFKKKFFDSYKEIVFEE